MTKDQSSNVLSDDERAIAQRLIDEIGELNLKATGIAEFHEMLTVETDSDGELLAGLYGWSWGGTCWIEALWVRQDMRRRGVGSRLLAAAEKHARRHGCTQLALDTHTFQAPSFYERHGFEIVGELTDYPKGHSKLLLRKQLPAWTSNTLGSSVGIGSGNEIAGTRSRRRAYGDGDWPTRH
jgi:GNAT superfamily N-acetyltransferase